MSHKPFTDGALIVDKPSGPTSHDVVALARRALGERRIGHTGTLDPLATGLLVLLVGRATRLAQFLVSDEKEYIADVRLGVSTPTYDAAPERAQTGVRPGSDRGQSGVRPASERGQTPGCDDLTQALERFRGTFSQTPPPFSAKKIAGRRAYELARSDRSVELKPVTVTVSRLDVISSTPDLKVGPSGGLVRLHIVCSAGFYVRSLAHDLGQALGCGAHLEALRRTRAGRFGLERAIVLDDLLTGPEAARERLVSMNDLLGHMAAITVTEEGARRVAHGNTVAREHVLVDEGTTANRGNIVRLVDAAGEILALAERRSGTVLHPVTVLV